MSERSDLRDGIIGSFIYLLLIGISVFGTPFSLLSLALLPLPSLIFTAKYSRKHGFIFVFVLVALSVLFRLFWVLVTLIAAGAGWVMGQFHHSERRSIRGLLLSGTVTLLAGAVLLLAFLSVVLDFQLAYELEKQWASTEALYMDMWAQMGLEMDEGEFEAVQEMLVSLLPAVFIVAAGSVTLLNHGIGRIVLQRMEVPVVKLPPFQEWYFPRSLLAWYIVSVIVLLMSDVGSYWNSAALTANWLLMLLFVVQALSLIVALIYRFTKQSVTWLWVLVVLLFPFMALALLFLYVPLSFLGMLDIGFRFRDKFRPR